jgi:hypothetical protein
MPRLHPARHTEPITRSHEEDDMHSFRFPGESEQLGVVRVLPFGGRLSRMVALAFVIAGIWVAAGPATVPDLTQPGSARAMQAM